MEYLRWEPRGSVAAMHARAKSWMSLGVRFAGLKARTEIGAGTGSLGARARTAEGLDGRASSWEMEAIARGWLLSVLSWFSALVVSRGSSLSWRMDEERKGEVKVEAMLEAYRGVSRPGGPPRVVMILSTSPS